MPEQLEFFDLRSKSWFTSSNYTTEINTKGMLIARASSPSGTQTTKILRKA